MRPQAPTVFGLVLSASLAAGVPAGAAGPGPLDEARALHVAGKWRQALAAYAEVTAGGEPADAAVAFNNSCVIHNRLADYSAALAACGEALAIRRGLDDERRLGRTLNNLGLALQRLGRYRQAEDAYREALDINRRLDDVEARLINLQNLGLTTTEAGRYGQALETFDEAEALAAAHAGEGWARYQGRLARLNRGVVLEKLGAYREALEIYSRLAQEREGLGEGDWASLQVNLGVIYRNLGDPVRAVEAFEEAAAAYRRLGDVAALSNATLNLALAWHLNLGRRSDAEDAYLRALELARESGDRTEEIQGLFYLGGLLLDQGRLDEAEATFGDCLVAAETADSAEGRWSADFGLGRVDAERGERHRALERFERAMDEIETVRSGLGAGERRAGYFGDKRPVYAAAVRTLAGLDAEQPDAGHGARAFEVAQRTKARELLESLGGAAGATAPAPAPLPAGELTELAADGVVVEYFAGERLYRWLIDAGEIRLDDLGAARPILDRALEVHRALSGGTSPAASTVEALARDLLSGVEARITGASRTWIAPDGALHYLPFEILPVAKASPLVAATEVAYLPSASTLGALAVDREPAELALAGFGDPKLSAAPSGTVDLSQRLVSRFGLRALPAAARELATIGDLLGGESEIVTGTGATEEAFRHVMAQGARVVHLATHTIVDERPGQGAAILLSPGGNGDGLLRPSEIVGLDLRVDLAVLATCSSALGGIEDGRAFASLTGSFLTAGASATLASLWDVGDEASAAFMSQFYYQLGRGHSPASALRRTKLRLQADPAWNRPDLWAAYILIGDAAGVAPRRLVPTWAWLVAALVALVAVVRWLSREER